MEDILSTFNNAHDALSFTGEAEQQDCIAFLDVCVERRIDGTLKRSIHRKPTWVGQYTHFSSFVPMQHKRNLVRCLVHRARNICTDDTLDDELAFIHNTLRLNGYPDRFIVKHMKSMPRKPSKIGVEKKLLHMNLAFKGDVTSELLVRRLSKVVDSTFPAAKLKLTFSTFPLLKPQLKDRLPSSTTSMCIYQFNCSCGAGYVGRTTRRLSTRIREHHPAWLGKGVVKGIRSSIVEHLVDTGHQVEIDNAFSVCYKVTSRVPKGVRFRLLCIAESIGIRIIKPELCIQKNLSKPLMLPWPDL